MKKVNRYAVTGFFEELPAAVLVIVAITIFLLATVNSLAIYFRAQQMNNLLNATNNFENSILTYRHLIYNSTYNGTYKAFDVNKLYRIENGPQWLRLLESELHPPGNFFINITDRETNKVWLIGDALPSMRSHLTIISVTTPVNIQVNNNVVDLGVMELYVWQQQV